MCIRDRYQRRVHGGFNFFMKGLLVFLLVILFLWGTNASNRVDAAEKSDDKKQKDDLADKICEGMLGTCTRYAKATPSNGQIDAFCMQLAVFKRHCEVEVSENTECYKYCTDLCSHKTRFYDWRRCIGLCRNCAIDIDAAAGYEDDQQGGTFGAKGGQASPEQKQQYKKIKAGRRTGDGKLRMKVARMICEERVLRCRRFESDTGNSYIGGSCEAMEEKKDRCLATVLANVSCGLDCEASCYTHLKFTDWSLCLNHCYENCAGPAE
eukprot:TRINITY_DN7899_c0_g1_i1.p1 TRINITY_DN7899_c0_g1~~TRINITY_DN7899_c0_g1_i1.p1  ORF type:complete len:290 (+),score=63.80 TRINITY_DN7899_c0_g1_i1:73-870(+)